MSKSLRGATLALVLGIAAGSGLAAEGNLEEEDAGEAIGDEVVVVEQSDEAEARRERPPRPPVARDVFVPSEEISEDVEVPFPVDI
ncbi:MAG: hypothetical protein F4Y01_04705 [Gammaproteobacteria bacterium]|nr:hypothetical protein [Gammaproteobacteria bacterium]